nr:hypothetical protein [Tanacetum cinerariifolium]
PLRADSAQLFREPRLRSAPRPGARLGAGGRALAARGPHIPGRTAAPPAYVGLVYRFAYSSAHNSSGRTARRLGTLLFAYRAYCVWR